MPALQFRTHTLTITQESLEETTALRGRTVSHLAFLLHAILRVCFTESQTTA